MMSFQNVSKVHNKGKEMALSNSLQKGWNYLPLAICAGCGFVFGFTAEKAKGELCMVWSSQNTRVVITVMHVATFVL